MASAIGDLKLAGQLDFMHDLAALKAAAGDLQRKDSEAKTREQKGLSSDWVPFLSSIRARCLGLRSSLGQEHTLSLFKQASDPLHVNLFDEQVDPADAGGKCCSLVDEMLQRLYT
eukprot:10853229-Alexandrium_andersonii.AAC.1